MANIFCANLDQLRQLSSVAIENCTEAYIGDLKRKFIYINNEGGQDDNQTVIIPGDNPASGRWICPQSPSIPTQEQEWNKLDKAGSKLSDLDSRSASDLDSGTIHYLRLPDGVPYFDNVPKNLVLTTDENGNYSLSHVTVEQITGLLPFARINWESFLPEMVGAESLILFDPNHFDRDDENHISIKLMSNNQPGLSIPGTGIETDTQGRINVVYGTGDNQALEGTTPLAGDLSGTHSAAVVDALRNIPLTFNFNELTGKDGWVLTLDSKNANTPFFYLAESKGGGSGSGLPSIAGKKGALLTDGNSVFWDKIPQSLIKPDFAITSFSGSFGSLEVGQSVINPTFNASYNDTIKSAALSDSTGNNDIISTDFNHFTSNHTFRLSSIRSISFMLSVVAIDGTNKSANTSASWLAKKFFGHLPLQSNPTIAINSLQSSQLASSRSGNFTVNASALEYIYFAIPSSFGTPNFSVGGFSGGFQVFSLGVPITNSYGITLNYDIYRSDNLGLGSTTVSVS